MRPAGGPSRRYEQNVSGWLIVQSPATKTWLRGTPAEHWGLGSQVIAKLGGRKLVLDAAGRAALERDPPLVKIGYDAWVPPEPGVLGWFDFREAIATR